MGFQQSAGRFVVTDTDGRVAFDTNYRTLHQTGYFTGQIIIAERNCIENEIDTNTAYFLGAVPSVCNAVMGSCYVERISNFPSGAFEMVPLNVWMTVGGTIDLTMGRGQQLLSDGSLFTGGPDSSGMVGIQQLSFEIIGTSLYAWEQIKYMRTRASSLLQTTFGGSPSYRVTYHLFAMAVDL